jgi:uncharacterized protein (TIGR02996 family)
MSNEGAFLTAIREDSDGDTPRLIYADWLEERGDPRAEFLRVECLLASLPLRDNQYTRLKGRLRSMAARVDQDWVGLVSRVPLGFEPDDFFFESQGWTHFTVRWQNERLVHFPEGSWVGDCPPHDLFPSAEEWRAFWSVLEDLRSWDWVGDYGSGIICGVPWDLRVSYRGRALACSGNGFDGDAAPPGFAGFFRALRRLIQCKDSAEGAEGDNA